MSQGKSHNSQGSKKKKNGVLKMTKATASLISLISLEVFLKSNNVSKTSIWNSGVSLPS